RKGTWAQFGIAADPRVAQAWRTKPIADDPYAGISNRRGTVAFAFKDPNARTTQVFINLKDNSETHDKEPFVVFGSVEEGMDAADRQPERGAQAVGFLADELQASYRHQKRARAHHDRERGALAHAEKADQDHTRRVQSDAQRHQCSQEEIARHGEDQLRPRYAD